MDDHKLCAAVIGAGSWGTAFARLLAQQGHDVVLWARDPRLVEGIEAQRENRRYLPGVPLPGPGLAATENLRDLKDREVYFLAVPSFAVRELAARLRATLGEAAREPVWVSLTKGLEYGRPGEAPRTPSQVLREVLGCERVLALSGPSYADEVVRGFPTAVILAGEDLRAAKRLQRALITERFRVYTGTDLLGVELGGAMKNVIAIAVGVSDGLGFGENARGALVSRGLAEMVRLGSAMGAHKETFFGLAGLGDLVITCTSQKSRNHTVGERIGRGERLESILSGMEMVAEGVYAVRAAHRYARARGLELPITHAVYEVLYEGARPLMKMSELMTRRPKQEEL